jgi:hypothetical protein
LSLQCRRNILSLAPCEHLAVDDQIDSIKHQYFCVYAVYEKAYAAGQEK